MDRNDPIVAELRKALDALLQASEHLGSINGSFGWNAAYSKVEAAEKKYDDVLKRLLDGMGYTRS